MNHRYINSIEEDRTSALIYLYGTIGGNVDGNQFARELRYLDSEVDVIKLHINSTGGEVFQGLGIISAIRSAVTPVEVYVDGVAASMAAVIAVCGSKVYMHDYSMFMVHDPSYANSTQSRAKEQKVLDKIKKTLVTILGSRGKDEEQISQLMTEETWFSAEEALAHNLCDEILVSPKSSLKNLSPDEIMNKINNLHTKKEEKMKLTTEAAKVLNIAEESSNDALSSAVLKLNQERVAAMEAKNSAEKTLQEMQAAQKAVQAKEAETLIDSAIRSGRINAEAKAVYTNFFESNFENAKVALEAIPERKSVAGQLDGGAPQDKLLALSWDEAFRTNKLEEVKNKHPEHFEALKKAEFKE